MARTARFLIVLPLLACSQGRVPSHPTAAIAPVALSGDLTRLDVCRAVPREDIEAVLGRKLAADPKPFNFYDTPGAGGCWYEGAKAPGGEAFYGYVVFTPIAAYTSQPLYQKGDVAGLGQSAYFNNGADARQLWVKVNDQVAFVVAFGDRPREDGAKELAALVLAAVKGAAP